MKGLIKDENLAKSINLIKGEPMFAENYWMTYVKDTIIGNMRKFEIDFRAVDDAGNTKDEFTLHPNVLYTNDFSKVASTNPSTKHYLTKDIFTNVSSLPKSQMDTKFAKEMEDTIKYEIYEGQLNDTIFTKKNYVVLKHASFNPQNPNYLKESNDFGIEVDLIVGDISDNKPIELNPALGVKDNLIFTYPGKADEFNFKVKLDETILNNFFTPEGSLEYETFVVKEGETFQYKDYDLTLKGFDREPQHAGYKKVEGDIAVATLLDINHKDEHFTLAPVFVVRQMRPMNIKDYNLSNGLHTRFIKVDPNTQEYTLQIASDNRSGKKIPIQIAENVPRTDFITLEAKIFPGINLFWFGSIFMMLGLLLGFINRMR